MTVEKMNGQYLEFVGRYLDHYEAVKADERSVAEAKTLALDTEKDLYLTTYENGILTAVEVLIGNKDGLDYPRSIGNLYYEELPVEMKFRYSLLRRLQSDCEYFLHNGHGHEKFLWAGTVEKQIEKMEELWNSFENDEKPEWLTMEQIYSYERKMLQYRTKRRGKDPYKIDQLVKMCQALEEDEWFAPQVTTAWNEKNIKPINLDKGALLTLIEYYRGEND